MRTPLYEQYRPKSLAEVIGQAKAVKRIETTGNPGGRAYWISGISGSGKTTLARIIAGMIADRHWIIEYDSADQFRQSELEEWTQLMYVYGGGQGGRALIINEAHGLRAPIIRQLLGVLERLPEHTAIVFTTTRDGQDSLFDDEPDAHPLLSRCIELALTTQGLAKPFAARAREIAQAEGLDGQPEAAYVKLCQRHHNNMRAVLQSVEAGEMKDGAA